ncbi:MAG: hypothetical protein ACRDTU_07270 [Micromonosporaceae bacterium]
MWFAGCREVRRSDRPPATGTGGQGARSGEAEPGETETDGDDDGEPDGELDGVGDVGVGTGGVLRVGAVRLGLILGDGDAEALGVVVVTGVAETPASPEAPDSDTPSESSGIVEPPFAARSVG